MKWLVFSLMTVASWGVYGIFLHKGQMLMGDAVNGRYKAFLFVGIAYFITAVLAPLAILHWARYLATREPVLASRRGWYVRSYTRVRKVLEPRIGPELDGLGSRICQA